MAGVKGRAVSSSSGAVLAQCQCGRCCLSAGWRPLTRSQEAMLQAQVISSQRVAPCMQPANPKLASVLCFFKGPNKTLMTGGP